MGKILASAIMPHPPILLPEIGRGEEEKAIKTIDGMKKVSKLIREKDPDTIIIISPHGPIFRDACSITVEEGLSGNFADFGHKNLSQYYTNDLDLASKIIDISEKKNLPLVSLDQKSATSYGTSIKLDWGIMVPMYFVTGENGKEKSWLDSKSATPKRLIPMTYGILEPEKLKDMGVAIKEAVEKSDKNVVIIASGDLSHRLSKTNSNYAFHEMGPVFEKKIGEVISKADIDGIINFDPKISNPAGECGLRSFQIMAGSFTGERVNPNVYSHEAPYGVGYMTGFWESF